MKEDWDGAISDFGEAINKKPDNADVYFRRGVAKYKKKDWNGAILDFDEAINKKSDNARAYFNRGVVKFKKKEWNDAISDFVEAIRIKPDYEKACSNCAECYRELAKIVNDPTERTKNEDKAKEYEERAEKLRKKGKA